MDSSAPLLDALRRPQRWALRLLLIKATAGRRQRRHRCRPRGAGIAWSQARRSTRCPRPRPCTACREPCCAASTASPASPTRCAPRWPARRDQSALHHLLIVGALSQIGRRFDEAGLSWVAMKGPVVAPSSTPTSATARTATSTSSSIGATSRRPCGSSRTSATRTTSTTGRWPRRCSPVRSACHEPTVHDRPALAPALLASRTAGRSPSTREAMIERGRRVVDLGRRHARRSTRSTRSSRSPSTPPGRDGHRLDVAQGRRAVGRRRRTRPRRARAALPAPTAAAPPVGLILGRARALLDADDPDDVVRALMPTLAARRRPTPRRASSAPGAAARATHRHPRVSPGRCGRRSPAALVAVPARAARSLRRRAVRRPPRTRPTTPTRRRSYLARPSSASDARERQPGARARRCARSGWRSRSSRRPGGGSCSLIVAASVVTSVADRRPAARRPHAARPARRQRRRRRRRPGPVPRRCSASC